MYYCKSCNNDNVHLDLNQNEFWCADCQKNTILKCIHDEEIGVSKTFLVTADNFTIQEGL